MKKPLIRLIVLFFVVILSNSQIASAQHDNTILNRLQAIANGGVDFYNVDGVTVTYEVTQLEFTKANICKQYKQYVPNESELKQSDPTISKLNFVVERADTACGNIVLYTTYYFVELSPKSTAAIIYSSPGKNDKTLQHTLNPLILDKKIPDSVFNKMFFNSINFAGRKIELGTYMAKWTNINTVQWSYHGEMNWSVHRDSLDAALSVEMQRKITRECNSNDIEMSVASDDTIKIIFEGVPATARKTVFKAEGETAALLEPTGGGGTKELIIYYVVAPVRGNWVSCVMSHWNNDTIEESGLPELLEKVMKLQ